MNVTAVQLNALENGNVKAIGSITLDDEFIITGIQVVKGKKGSFVSLPQRRDKQGRFRDVAFPKTAELRKKINSAVLKQYKKLAA